MKQFRYYLLGSTFQLMTDHAPLQWLGEQNMEGFCVTGLWKYKSSTSKSCTGGAHLTEMLHDAMLRMRETDRETLQTAMTTVHTGFPAKEIRQAQQQDDTILHLYNALNSDKWSPHKGWKKPPLRIYAQLWSQLNVVDGMACRKYHPGPTSDTVVVSVLPETLHQQV